MLAFSSLLLESKLVLNLVAVVTKHLAKRNRWHVSDDRTDVKQ
jgi:hypothetical protein